MFLYNNKSTKEKRRILRKNQTKAEAYMWQFLRRKQFHNIRFTRQYSVGPYILDFYSSKKRLGIEVDGGHHSEEQNIIADDKRSMYLQEHDITIIRFWNNEVLRNIEGVIETLEKLIVNNPSSPPLILSGGTSDFDHFS